MTWPDAFALVGSLAAMCAFAAFAVARMPRR
jgi:hypothetical protein